MPSVLTAEQVAALKAAGRNMYGDESQDLCDSHEQLRAEVERLTKGLERAALALEHGGYGHRLSQACSNGLISAGKLVEALHNHIQSGQEGDFCCDGVSVWDKLEAAEAEVKRLTAHLETIERLCKNEAEETYSPGGIQAALALRGSNRPLERIRDERDAALAALERLTAATDYYSRRLVEEMNRAARAMKVVEAAEVFLGYSTASARRLLEEAVNAYRAALAAYHEDRSASARGPQREGGAK